MQTSVPRPDQIDRTRYSKETIEQRPGAPRILPYLSCPKAGWGPTRLLADTWKIRLRQWCFLHDWKGLPKTLPIVPAPGYPSIPAADRCGVASGKGSRGVRWVHGRNGYKFHAHSVALMAGRVHLMKLGVGTSGLKLFSGYVYGSEYEAEGPPEIRNLVNLMENVS